MGQRVNMKSELNFIKVGVVKANFKVVFKKVFYIRPETK